MIYAKCSVEERIELWNDLYFISDHYSEPWIVGGDFNVILGSDEKIGGLPVYIQGYEDFAFCINSFLINRKLHDLVGNIELQHLERTRSDHAPLLVTCGGLVQNCIKPFRFLKF
ncbi:hypothetical protein R3W88_008136 [Solanum pinnatisectum]|uniref:Endonuclease/exonuclease/phosphatase domain-containing protein n=1 Tax=Solanum pinnatisectum TaxID=50273 RepID=A0AAV9MA39_9SOLN|nr:hypothetical protein R3W88_008136 [Solanum pinnatisectum]